MAWGIAIRNPERSEGDDAGFRWPRAFGRRWAWPRWSAPRLAQIILAANGFALLILIIGMLAVSETRRGLVEAKIDALRAEGELIANILAEGAAESDPAPVLLDGEARAILRQLYVPEDVRVRIFDKGVRTVADSHLLTSRFDVERLPDIGETDGAGSDQRPVFTRMLEGLGAMLRTREEREALRRSLRNEVDLAILGETVSGVRRQEDGTRVVSVSIPIQPVQAVVGVVTLESFDLDELIASERRALAPFILIAAVVTILSSLMLTVFIARPVRRLALAAHEARLAGGKRVKMPHLEGRKDEIGELGLALHAMTEALYDRMDAIEQFAADVAHELKNPLTSIRSAVEVLPKAKDAERRDRLLAVIQSDVKRLDRLITDISRASRLDAELAREDTAPVDLSTLLRDIVESYRDSRSDGPDIVFDPAVEAAPIRGRAGPIGQVIRNLIDNAITFSPADRPSKVRVALYRGHYNGFSAWTVAVEDDGPGIPPDNLEAVFKRFYTDRPKGAAFGTHSGLGLAIARQIVKAHGGSIIAENRAGADGQVRGARFVILLPAERG